MPVDGSAATKIPLTVNAEVAIGPEVKFDYPISDSATFTVKQIRDAVPSPDGRRIAFTALDRLYVADLPNGAPRRLTNQEVGEYYPTWSPDGTAIAYATWDDNNGQIMRVPGGGRHPAAVDPGRPLSTSRRPGRPTDGGSRRSGRPHATCGNPSIRSWATGWGRNSSGFPPRAGTRR